MTPAQLRSLRAMVKETDFGELGFFGVAVKLESFDISTSRKGAGKVSLCITRDGVNALRIYVNEKEIWCVLNMAYEDAVGALTLIQEIEPDDERFAQYRELRPAHQ